MPKRRSYPENILSPQARQKWSKKRSDALPLVPSVFDAAHGAPKRSRPSRLHSYISVPIEDLKIDPSNPRKHSRQQERALARSIDKFGFNAPILADRNNRILAGEGRLAAAKLLGLTHVPVLRIEHLSDTGMRAYALADNKLHDRSSFDDKALAVTLKELSLIADFDIETTGFEQAEIDLRIQSLEDNDDVEKADEFEISRAPAVSAVGDLWLLGGHRVYCGSALDSASYTALFASSEKAAAVFTDPPYNVPIDGHATGKGRTRHREFPMASGEMPTAEFTEFLKRTFENIAGHTIPGGLVYSCMDWRHNPEIQNAADQLGWELVNLCVWVKTNGGMGSLYRSRHELVFVFRNGKEPHLNNVQLGRFGRNRTNVWNYPSPAMFGRKTESRLHPTVKPVLMVADAILDTTKQGDIVLDPFLGSGTTALAAERTGRRCYGVELDPLYVDTIIERWQKMTGRSAQNGRGEGFDDVRLQRRGTP